MPESLTITLYGKADCHLCEQAEEQLAAVTRELGQQYRKVDICSAPDLFDQFRYRIPVIRVDGGAELDWPVTPGRIRRAILDVTRT